MLKISPELDLGKPTNCWKCTCRQHLHLCCYPLCRRIASSSPWIFKILNCHTISSNTFRHQKQYLQPAISTTWKSQQLVLLSSLKAQKLVLSGDGRADSLGHSAKYGSYTVIEMSCNKVLDYRLVQVCVCACGMCICVCMYMYVYVCVFVGSCLATKVFVGNLPALDPGMGWVIIK